MAGKQAKTLNADLIQRILDEVDKSPTRSRDRLIVLLSLRAGLRACEIAGLEWCMVVDANGELSSTLEVEDRIAKKRSGRRIPVHPELRAALEAVRGAREEGPIIKSARGGGMQPNSIVNWYVALFNRLGLKGCSSHSGRRTFITTAARSVHKVGGSLRDVQILAGHKSLSVTQGYIDGDTDIQRRLVGLL